MIKKGFFLYFIGLSGSGKTTISTALYNTLNKKYGSTIQLIDGDDIRNELGNLFGYTYDERMKNNKVVSVICKYLLKNNISVILSQVAGYKKMRENVRNIFPEGYIEIYIKCSYSELTRRDVKGYYKKAEENNLENFNGITDVFEEPEESNIVVDTEEVGIEGAVKLIIDYLKQNDYISNEYEYVTDDNLENTQKYEYSDCFRQEFIRGYTESRLELMHNRTNVDLLSINFDGKVNNYLNKIYGVLVNNQVKNEDIIIVDSLLRSFEVKKRIYTQYDDKFSPMLDASYRNYNNYLVFAIILLLMIWENRICKKSYLKYVNALFKLCDTLISIYNVLNEKQQNILKNILYQEQVIFAELLNQNRTISSVKNIEKVHKSLDNPTVLKDISLIASNTSRTKMYLKQLLTHNLIPNICIVYSADVNELLSEEKKYVGDIKHDIEYDVKIVPLICLLKQFDVAFELVNSGDINSPEVINTIKETGTKYCIYSGYGGQILKQDLFSLGIKYIHVHSGKLPQYRGSTTIYYSILEKSACDATAIFLNEKIDAGEIIATREFPVPINSIDVDRDYDPFIRGEVLLDVLYEYLQSGEISSELQNTSNTNMFFIIHPALKFLALNKRPLTYN